MNKLKLIYLTTVILFINNLQFAFSQSNVYLTDLSKLLDNRQWDLEIYKNKIGPLKYFNPDTKLYETRQFNCKATWNDIDISLVPTKKLGSFITVIVSGVEGYGTLKVYDEYNSLLLTYKSQFFTGDLYGQYVGGVNIYENQEGNYFSLSDNFAHRFFGIRIGAIDGYINIHRKDNHINLIDSKIKIILNSKSVKKIEYFNGAYLEVETENLYFGRYLKDNFKGTKYNTDGSVEKGLFSRDKLIDGIFITSTKDTLRGKTDLNNNFIVSKVENPRDKWKKTNSGCEVFCFACSAKEITWTGGCINGKVNGKGITKNFGYDGKLESTYDGNFLNGFKNGLGTQILSSGEKYTGNWVNGVKQGNGTYIWSNNSKYVGIFKNDQFNGMGISYFDNGKVYERGTFKNDELYNGTKYFEDGTIEYTMINGTKKLSSSAEKIAQLETELKTKSSTSNTNQNSKSEMERLNSQRPCIIKFDEKASSFVGSTKDYVYDIKIPLKNGEYEKGWIKIYNLESGSWTSYDDGTHYFKSKNEVINNTMKIKGCNNWFEQK